MASGMRQVLSRSRSVLSTTVGRNHNNHRYLRNNLLHSWGSTRRGRETSAKLLGFSASLALCGFGAHLVKNNYFEDKKESEGGGGGDSSGRKLSSFNFNSSPPWPVEVLRISDYFKEKLISQDNTRFQLDTRPLRIQKWSNIGGYFSSFSIPLLKYFGLLTPVACVDAACENSESKEQGGGGSVDVICMCMSCEAERKWNIGNDGGGKGSNGGKDSCEFKLKNQEEALQKCEQEKEKQRMPVTNRRCGSASMCNRISDPVDVDALSKELGNIQQMDWSLETDLSHCILMRQASQVAVDAVTRIVTEAVTAYDDYHAEYRRLLDMLIQALEASRKACGQDVEVIECRIILLRAKVDDMKRKIHEIDVFLASLEKFCHAAAETAFMSHAEYASIAMSERLQSMCQEVKRLREETKELERDMLELQSLIIVETGKGLK